MAKIILIAMNIKLYKKALFLEYSTIAWNIFEGISCVAIGILCGSVSLFAYGLESSIEVFASSLVVWELKGVGKKREEKALKLIGVAYLLVSLYVFIDAAKSLFEGNHATPTMLGIVFLAITFFVMMGLGVAKNIVGGKMKSATVLADAKFTLIDGALSATVLLGLVFNFLLGWWWMDQALALFLSGVAFREGAREIL